MYNIYKNGIVVGTSLSKGELNQWLIELDLELSNYDSKVFRANLGFNDGDFESYIYENDLKFPIEARFGTSNIMIEEFDF